VVRSGLTPVLLAYDDLKMIGEAGSGEEALRKCGRSTRRGTHGYVMPGMGTEPAATKLSWKSIPERVSSL
jgi:DNA-binding NarL/FixJ family response regulator